MKKIKKTVKATKIKAIKRTVAKVTEAKAERIHNSMIVNNGSADVYDCSVWLERQASKTKSKADKIVIAELLKILGKEVEERHFAKYGVSRNAHTG